MSAEKFMVEFIRALKENDTIGSSSGCAPPTCC